MTGCSPIPNKVLGLLSTLSRSSALAVYLHLVVKHGYEEWFDLSQRELADELAKSRPTIIEALAVLGEQGLIRVSGRGQGHTARAVVVGATCVECSVTCHKTCQVSSHVKKETQLAPVALWEEPEVEVAACKESNAVEEVEMTNDKDLMPLKVLGGSVKGDGRPREVWDYWNSKNITVHKFVTDKQEKSIRKALALLDRHMSKEESLAEVLRAIDNYATCLHGDQYRWNYKWTLDNFLDRGLDKFRDEADPLNREIDREYKGARPHQNFAASRTEAFEGL